MKKLLILLLFYPVALFAQPQTINVGSAANDGTGDPLRTAMQKVNTNDAAAFDSIADLRNDIKNPSGSTGELQFYSSGSFGATPALKWFDSDTVLRIGNDFTDPSARPMLSLNKNLYPGATNGHGFVDINNVYLSAGRAYAGYDARFTLKGNTNTDHANGYQSAMTYSNTGTINRSSGMSAVLTVTAGTVTNAIGYKINAPVVTGGSVTNYYGFYMDGNITSATNNWFFYNNGTTESYLGGNLGIGVNPTYELDVDGDVNVTGDFRINGTIFSGSGVGDSVSVLWNEVFVDTAVVPYSQVVFGMGYGLTGDTAGCYANCYLGGFYVHEDDDTITIEELKDITAFGPGTPSVDIIIEYADNTAFTSSSEIWSGTVTGTATDATSFLNSKVPPGNHVRAYIDSTPSAANKSSRLYIPMIFY